MEPLDHSLGVDVENIFEKNILSFMSSMTFEYNEILFMLIDAIDL